MKIYVKASEVMESIPDERIAKITQAIINQLLCPAEIQLDCDLNVDLSKHPHLVSFYTTNRGKQLNISIDPYDLRLIELSALQAMGTDTDAQGYYYASRTLGSLPKPIRSQLYDNLDKIADILSDYDIQVLRPIRPNSFYYTQCTAPIQQ